MKVIRPVAITDSGLIESSVPETDHAVYDPATNYAVGDQVIYDHVSYECVQTPNAGNAPDVSPLYWAPVGTTNRWLMFDGEVGTQTLADQSLEVTIAPGLVDSLALLNLLGANVRVVVRDGDGGPVLYDHNYPLDGSEVFDWYQYFYQPFIEVHEVVLTDLPLYGSAHITITLTGAGSVAVGILIAGTAFFIGDTQYGATAGIIDFSRKETNQTTGATSFNKRKFSKRVSGQLMLENYALNNVYRILADLRATPSVWVGTDSAGFEPLILFGFYRDFSIEISYPTASLCSLEVEGLI